ncbi:hypothetical protein TrCOL_g7606 [Triparma columacea]|uniref:SGF29 C-terminal domain-containing protein n=1 Tax=Triparma columacea TaxID=722753 RepID=A0A9W7GMB9_9STRA|nr:hypothetical protein TrCOL_g7606 [Triparma columacea]
MSSSSSAPIPMGLSRFRSKEESETNLEYILDTISGFPLPLKRHLDHIHDITGITEERRKQLRAKENNFLDNARASVREFPWVEGTTTSELMGVVGQEEELDAIRAEHSDVIALATERFQTSERACQDVDEQVARIDSMLRSFESRLRDEGVFSQMGAQPGDQVAIQLEPGNAEWVLGKVTGFNPETSIYKIQDEDVDSGSKNYTLPHSQVMQLGLTSQFNKGDNVMAVYPETTSFYSATVVTMRKVASGSMVYVLFQDDKDEMGVTHEKPIAANLVLKF